MIEPYATLMGQYQTHYWLADYLTEDEPDWAGIANDPRLDGLGTGEKVLLDLGACLANVKRHCDIDNQVRVMSALAWIVGARR